MDKKQPCSGKVGGGGNQGVGFKRYLVAQINKAMGALQLRKEITSKLEKVDMTVLRAIDAMLDVYTDEDSHHRLYEPNGKEIDIVTFEKETQDSIANAKPEESISLTDYKKKTEAWLNATK